MEKKRESNSGNMCFGEGVLPNDVWRYIGLKLDSAADRIRFRAVSKTWMSLVPFRQPPWLMLAEQLPPLRGFVCVGEQNTHLFDLPDLHQARCVGSTGNWLATIHPDESIRLLNPFTRHQFHLPPVSAFDYKLDSADEEDLTPPPDLYRDSFVRKIVLSSSPTDEDCVAVAVHHHYRVLAFARPQAASWTTIPLAGSRSPGRIGIQDMIFYNHKLYAITFDARLMACDIPLAGEDAPQLSFLTHSFVPLYYKRKCYLVECRGELLLVIKFVESSLHLEDPRVQDPIYATKSFQVYKFDSSKFTELKSLGEYSLFLGFSTSVSVLASDYFGSVTNNSIYFTDDYTHGYRGTDTPGGHDMGVFNLEDATITPHYKGVSTSLYSPPVWIVPA